MSDRLVPAVTLRLCMDYVFCKHVLIRGRAGYTREQSSETKYSFRVPTARSVSNDHAVSRLQKFLAMHTKMCRQNCSTVS